MQKVWKRLPQWLRDTLMFILIMGCAVAVCELLSVCYDDNNPFATSVFILAVVLVSRFTTGYWPGILASAVGVVSVNYLFTYPFHEFNLTIDGYPLTFAVMLVVSVLVSTLTTQIKRQEQLRYEAERDRMRANLLRSVSHDIRTPLTAIMGLSATVEESETLTDEGRGMVEEIHQNAQWLLHLSENILSVTRFCDEGVVIEKSDEVVEEIVGSAIRRFRKNCATDIPIAVTKPEEILLNHEDPRIPQVDEVYCFSTLDEVYACLRKGYCDAIAGHESALRLFMDSMPDEFYMLDESLYESELGVAFEKGTHEELAEELTRTLQEMQKDGTTGEILEKYGMSADRAWSDADAE